MTQGMEMPAGWVLAPASELLNFVTSGSRGWAQYYADMGAIFIRIGNLDHNTISLNMASVQHVIPPEGVEGVRTRVQAGDILISITAELGMVAFVPYGLDEAYINQHIALARPVSTEIAKYLAWFYASDEHGKRQLQAFRRGATKAGLGLDDIRSVLVPVPPLAEQRRIVAAIEQQFTRLDAGVASLRRAQAALKRYRAAVLKAAVEGKLTEAWRTEHPDAEPASALLARILAERRARWEADLRAKGKDPKKARYEEPVAPDTTTLPELPEGWCWATLQQCTARSEYGTSVKCSLEASGVPVLRIPNIAAGEIDLSDMKYATLPVVVTDDSALLPGDLLMCRTNGSISLIGKTAVVRTLLTPNHTFASYLLRFRLLETNQLPRWVHLCTASMQGRRFIEGNAASSAGQHNISLTLMHSMPLPVPPQTEQEQIVAEVERRLSVVDELEAEVAANLKRAERLRQVILREAFAGRLVPQDSDDEPASELLERVRQERPSFRGMSTRRV